jgi:uncharacterized iron-regulated membrane protein
MERRHWVALHRRTGLVLAAFLPLAGLTGGVLPFYRNLDNLEPEMEQGWFPRKSDPLIQAGCKGNVAS